MIKKRASLDGEILQDSVELVFLTRQGCDREVAAAVGEDDGDTFARFDHALDEHDFARSYAHSSRDEPS